MKIYYKKDVSTKIIENKKIAVLGFGSQGHAHALNLKDSGLDVIVGLYEGSKSWKKAEESGLKVMTVEDAAKEADIIMFLIPDQTQAEIYDKFVKPNLTAGKSIAFAHGFNIHYGQIVPPDDVDVWMVAPKSPGHLARRVFEQGGGVPCLIAVYQDSTGNAEKTALAYSDGIGGTRAGVIETTFEEETETDLFGEQAVLCGGVSELVTSGFETLVDAGYQPEIAYFECMHELKLIVDLFYESGLSGMYYSVSDTAEYGGLTRGRRVISEDSRHAMKEILSDIQSGKFAQEWILENRAKRPVLKSMRKKLSSHKIEEVGRKLRGMMQWVQKSKLN
ncbi:ketol-acid reductoisomerase [bacterium]|nr:ketol-acid reductoisomerase [bacterium]